MAPDTACYANRCSRPQPTSANAQTLDDARALKRAALASAVLVQPTPDASGQAAADLLAFRSRRAARHAASAVSAGSKFDVAIGLASATKADCRSRRSSVCS